jgi:hypothetical protein
LPNNVEQRRVMGIGEMLLLDQEMPSLVILLELQLCGKQTPISLRFKGILLEVRISNLSMRCSPREAGRKLKWPFPFTNT